MRIPGIGVHVGTGGALVASRLSDYGIDTIFSVPGSQVLPIWDALDGGIRVVVPRSERHAAFMAEGYGQACGFPAVLMNTLGPGVANELVGLASAKKSATPVLAVAPYQPEWKYSRIPEVFQGLDAPAFVRSVCKEARAAESAESIAPVLDEAFRSCLASPSGPVHVEISFPPLFARSISRPGASPSAQAKKTVTEPLLINGVSEQKNTELWKKLGLGGKERSLAPGMGPKYAIPFALGAKFAAMNSPVVAAIPASGLLEHLDSLATAQAWNIPVRLLRAGSPEEPLERTAEAFGIRIEKKSKEAELGPASLRDPKALALIVV